MKFAILGYGSIGKRHASNLKYLDHDIRIFDPDVVENEPMPRDIMIGGADGVIICTPTKRHFTDILDCYGHPVLVEKPIVYDTPVSAIQSLCSKRSSDGTIIATGFMCRFHECVVQAKKVIDQGDIGDIGWAEFWVDQKSEKPAYLMDGVIRNWASHEIDLALYLLGPGVASHLDECNATQKGQDTIVQFGIRHNSGAATIIHADYITDPEKRGFRITGSKGVIEGDLVNGVFKLTNTLTNSILHLRNNWDECYLKEMKEFIKAIKKGQIDRTSPLASGMDGAAVHDIVMQVRGMAGLVDD